MSWTYPESNRYEAISVMPEQKRVHLDIFTPAPQGTYAFIVDTALVEILNRYSPGITASWQAIAAPDHIHRISLWPDYRKKYALPIVPSTDFIPARKGKGPDWHPYPNAHTDLKYVACLGFFAFGIATYQKELNSMEQLHNKVIGGTARPSSLRILQEAIAFDTSEFSKPIIKDVNPSEVKQALEKGEIDATFWFQNFPTIKGYPCLLHEVLGARKICCVSLSSEQIDSINNKHSWKTDRVSLSAGEITLSSLQPDPPAEVGMAGFYSAICAWDTTEDEIVYELVRFIDQYTRYWPDYSNGTRIYPERMISFPGLRRSMIHDGALSYYEEKSFLKSVDL